VPSGTPREAENQKQAQEKQDFIVQGIEKLKKAKLIREVAHPTWIANPVVVPKANGSGRLCVDFTSLNKACPQDPYPLPSMSTWKLILRSIERWKNTSKVWS
jgi:hypothetical protein